MMLLLLVVIEHRSLGTPINAENISIELEIQNNKEEEEEEVYEYTPLSLFERSVYLQALVDHHITILPVNLTRRDADLRCLAMNIYYESRGEPILGQLAVANVTMNRFNQSNRTICNVVYRPGQFEWTRRRLREPAGDSWRQATVLAWLVLNQPELMFDVTDNSLYFHSFRRTPRSFAGLEHSITIGKHRFYRGQNLEEVAQAPIR